ncbi:hypothetical protein M758_3G124600 [Ceratodon purpureus]|uniref:Transmembrane protein n=1 Tax=Ceratodon purpureus TaxID=3225 RepID=A0A8T0IL52_CERPU|nr:hypothetical protein KC19_3G123100 [Ceratodon purpureus]KAG0622802.1 hypothetical protein M758_3G124600 [Ceratodon purpureus]
MNNPNAPVAQQGRCACTLPFSLHLTVMILGIVGFILGIIVCILYFVLGNIWLLISTILVFASGLQGLLVVPGSGCFNCHIVLAVINLVNLGVFGVACIFLASPFWVIWVIAVFVMELWVTIARFCCKTVGETVVVQTQLPVAQPGVVHVVQGHPTPQTYTVDPRAGAQYQEGYKQPYGQ